MPLTPTAPHPHLAFHAVVAVAGGPCWLLGTSLTPAGWQRCAWRDDGAGFASVPDLPADVGVDVALLGAHEAWFAGVNGTIAHHDGAHWTRHTMPNTYPTMRDIVARPGLVWMAADAAGIVGFNGMAFHREQPAVLEGSSIRSLCFVGDELWMPVYRDGGSRVARRDAMGRWSDDELRAGAARCIHASAPDNVWIAGLEAVAWHFDGAAWARHVLPPGRYYALYTATADRAYLVGDAGALATWDGCRWVAECLGVDRLVGVTEHAGRLLVSGGSRLYRRGLPVA